MISLLYIREFKTIKRVRETREKVCKKEVVDVQNFRVVILFVSLQYRFWIVFIMGKQYCVFI